MATNGALWAIIYGADEEQSEGAPSDPNDPLLFRETLARVAKLVPKKRIVVAINPDLRARWASELGSLPPQNCLEAPYERGAPAAVLLAFFQVFRKEPTSRVLVIPADHRVADDKSFIAALEQAAAETLGDDSRAVLLGKRGADAPISTGIFIAGSSAMLRLYDHAMPGMLRSFLSSLRGHAVWSPEALGRLFRFLPKKRLGLDLLRPAAELLRVLPVNLS